jgi:hypothetical protein
VVDIYPLRDRIVNDWLDVADRLYGVGEMEKALRGLRKVVDGGCLCPQGAALVANPWTISIIMRVIIKADERSIT